MAEWPKKSVPLFLTILLLAGCPGGNAEPALEFPYSAGDSPQPLSLPEDIGANWKGYATQEEIAALKEKDADELKELLKDYKREPALRIEALRLLVEMTENKKELFPVLLAGLKSPTVREREATLYYFSRFGTPNHIVAIQASAMGIEKCPDYTETCGCHIYSVEYTINQIMERTAEKKK